MFFTNEGVVAEINKVYTRKSDNAGNNNLTPKMEDVLKLLTERKPILLFYLTTEYGEPEHVEADMQIPTINMTLNQFFMHPIGDEIWTNDESFKFITYDNYLLIKDSIVESIKERYNAYKVESIDDFVEKLNRNLHLKNN